MPAYPSSSALGAYPQPDLAPTGAERLAVRQRPVSAQMTPTPTTSTEQLAKKSARPEIPKKNKHIDENYRLRQKLNDLQGEYDQLQGSVEQMISDLDDAEQKLATQKKELEEKEAELTGTRKNVATLSMQLQQEKQSQARIEEKLKEQERSAQSEMQQKIESIFAAVGQREAKDNGDVARLQAEVAQLTNAVAAKDQEMKNIQSNASQTEQQLSGRLQAQLIHLAEQMRLREAAEDALAAQQQQASVGLEMAELRRLCNFYKENSERLSKQIDMDKRARRQVRA
ncbi:hypothetical protein LTS15_002749 [Exophiala xenobiotica]|nr:hypothetical protein LTS15_002749 [Exophiala xenobiotica]